MSATQTITAAESVQKYLTPEVEPSSLPDYVVTVNELVEKGLDATVSTEEEGGKKLTNIIPFIQQYDPRLVHFALGDFGDQLIKFGDQVCADHPSINDIQSGTLAEGGKVYNRVREAILLAEFARSSKFDTIPAVLQRWFDRNHKKITKVLLKPPPRLLDSDEARIKARNIQKPKNIDLGHIYEKGRSQSWYRLADSFMPYVRGGPGFKPQMGYSEKICARFTKLGMSYQANELVKEIDRYAKISENIFCGFTRVKMCDAALILAKTMGYDWKSSRRISAPVSLFNEQLWKTSSGKPKNLSEDPLLADMYDRHITVEAVHPQDSSRLHFSYAPRAYPLYSFPATQPTFVRSVISRTESHVDANGKPLFDQYWLIVPGINISSSSMDTYRLNDGNKTRTFNYYEQYQDALNKYLIETRQIFPILLGENVTKKQSYFLCYWA